MKSAQEIKDMKGKEKIVMLTCYDATMASLLDTNVDAVLVGDSLGMIMLGYENTTEVTLQEVLAATKAVARGSTDTLIIADLPIGTYDTEENALSNARAAIDAGAHAVKIERKPAIAKHLVANDIQVMGHIGLTPQTATEFKVQGKDQETASALQEEAQAMDDAGCFTLVLECIPIDLGKEITSSVSMPTIGIGAGKECDGQILVTHDMVGLFNKFKPKFVKRYADLGHELQQAVQKYSDDVKKGGFPDEEHSYH